MCRKEVPLVPLTQLLLLLEEQNHEKKLDGCGSRGCSHVHSLNPMLLADPSAIIPDPGVQLQEVDEDCDCSGDRWAHLNGLPEHVVCMAI